MVPNAALQAIATIIQSITTPTPPVPTTVPQQGTIVPYRTTNQVQSFIRQAQESSTPTQSTYTVSPLNPTALAQHALVPGLAGAPQDPQDPLGPGSGVFYQLD